MLLAAAFRSVGAALTVLDREHRVVAMNDYAQRATVAVLGRPLETGEDVLLASATGSVPGFLEGFGRALRGERVRRERKLTYPNGTQRCYFVEYVPLPGDDGTIDHVLFSAIDIARQVELEGRLRLLQAAIAQSPVALLVADAQKPDYPIVYASENLARQTGYTPEEVIGRNARVFQGRFRGDVALDVVRKALANASPCEAILRNERKDGTPFTNRLTLAPVRDEAGTVTHFLAVQQDVTEQQEMARRLRDAEVLEASSRAAAALAHDFNNVLGIISANVSFARESTPVGSDERQALDLALDGVHRAGAALRELLVVPGRARSEPCAVALAPALASLRKVTARVIPANVVVSVEPFDESLAVLIDPGALEQVLINLALNARDAMPDGGTLRLAAALDRVAQDRVTIVVADDGVGMPPEVMARVFEPLFSTKPRDRATGLGLASVVAIVSGAGGTIRCESAVGAGTRFIITLPRATLPSESGDLSCLDSSASRRRS